MDEDIKDVKAFDEGNIKVLNGILSESGYDGLESWFKEQNFDRQEYILELLENMVAKTINLKTQCGKSMIDPKPTLAEVIPMRRKPKFTVVK